MSAMICPRPSEWPAVRSLVRVVSTPIGKLAQLAHPISEVESMRILPKLLFGTAMIGLATVGFTATAPKVMAGSCGGGGQLCATNQVCIGEIVKICHTDYYYRIQPQ